MEIVGRQRAKEALDDRIVEAVAFTGHALRDAQTRGHRSKRLHLVLPSLIRLYRQLCARL